MPRERFFFVSVFNEAQAKVIHIYWRDMGIRNAEIVNHEEKSWQVHGYTNNKSIEQTAMLFATSYLTGWNAGVQHSIAIISSPIGEIKSQTPT